MVGSGRALSVMLGPGLLGGIFDGLLRPLTGTNDFQVQPGMVARPPGRFPFTPHPGVGTDARPGQVIGSVSVPREQSILVPPGIAGRFEWTVDGEERHHQIDPATEVPSTTDLDAVTVIAATGWLAEVHATAAIAEGSGGAIAYLTGHGLTGIAIVHDDQSVLMTTDLADVVMTVPAVRAGVR